MSLDLSRTAYALRHPGQHSTHRPRTVLVLGGGGMRGMAHIGVLKAMRTLGIEYDAIVGTSIGALVGAMAAGGLSIEKIESLVANMQKEDYFRLNFLKFLFKGTRTQSMYHGETFKATLRKILPDVPLSGMKVPFYCNAVRLETGGSVFWGTPGMQDIDIFDAVYSSCALPGVFEPYEKDGFNYMDGGMVDSVPLRFAKTLNPELIIAVDLSLKGTFKAPDYKNKLLSTLYRTFEIVEEVLVEQSLHMHVDWRVALIQPKVSHTSRFDFEKASEVVREGEDRGLEGAHLARRDARARQHAGDRRADLPGAAEGLRLDPHRRRALHRLRDVRDGLRDRGLLGARREGDGEEAVELRVHARSCLRAQLPDGRDLARESLSGAPSASKPSGQGNSPAAGLSEVLGQGGRCRERLRDLRS